VKLLLDQNPSPRLVQALRSMYPGSAHVRDFGLQSAQDEEIWAIAGERGFTIVSKDPDFHQRSFLHGAPPKVVWLRVGNRTTDQALEVLVRNGERLAEFELEPEAAFLVLE
jgi:predicted nuclease of predicted toxin-antitoxin system